MTIEYCRIKTEEFCRKHKCMKVWVNKIAYEVHFAMDQSGYILDGPLPDKKKSYQSVKSAVDDICRNSKKIEQELKERQTSLPL